MLYVFEWSKTFEFGVKTMIKTSKLCMLLLTLGLSFSAESVTVYGHRGARGLAPENTLPAFQAALDHHVDVIDLDVVMTEEGVLIAHHDLTLNPDLTRDEAGEWVDSYLVIKHLTLQQLKTYDVGRMRPTTPYAAMYASQSAYDHTQIPTLKEVIHYVNAHADYPVGFQIEVKTDPTDPDLSVSPEAIITALEKIIREEGIQDRTKVQAFDWHCLQLLQNLNPYIATAYLTDLDYENTMRDDDPYIAGQWTGGYLIKDYHDSIPEMIHALGGSWWDAEDIEITPELIEKAHQFGLKVAAWPWPEHTNPKGVNIPLVEQLIAMAVDGIITDRPDVVMQLLTPSQTS